MDPIAVGVVGIGKIACDQHLPVIAASADFRLAAAASHGAHVAGVATYKTLEEMLCAAPQVQAVALCTPPQDRHLLAATALRAGKHVLLEKPPGAGLAEVEDLRLLAKARGVSLFATWHSRYAPAVEPARAWLADKRVRGVRIEWREDVRRWHPGQAWIWEAGGLGVFDPGINALSIATAILPRPFFLHEAELQVPANRQSPIAAELAFTDEDGAHIAMSLDWLQTGPQTWDIHVETDADALTLSQGGAQLSINGASPQTPGHADLHLEYASLYARFAELIRSGHSDVDVSPLRHVVDAFAHGRRVQVAAFED